MSGMVKDSVLGLGLSTSKIPVDVGRGGLAPVGTCTSSEEGAASTKEVPAGEGSCNDPTIGSYNHYHLSPNVIPSSNQRWYGLVYLEYT